MSSVPAAHLVPLDLRRPFTRADALEAGVSPSALKGSRFRRIFRGVLIHASVPPHPVQRVEAALLVHPPSAFASHTSAGRLYDVPLPTLPDEHVSVFHARDRRGRPGLRAHVARIDAPVTVVRGLRASAPVQMFVELGEVLSLVDLVVVGDALVRLGLVTSAELRDHCASAARPGARARRAATYVREQVDSPMETRLRMLLVLAGLPEPTINHRVIEHGRVRYRFDLSYPWLKILVEYDGRQHRADLDQWDADTSRRDWLDANGWLHVEVFSRGIYRSPGETISRVEAVLRRRGAVLPRRRSDEWRPHFPGQ